MKRTTLIASALPLLALGAADTARATETLRFQYDARGRLVRAERTGNAQYTANYSYDAAGNRTQVRVTTGSGGVPGPPGRGLAVFPLQGKYRAIPLRSN